MKLPALPDFSKMSRRERLLTFGSLMIVSMVLLDRVVLGPWGRHMHHVRQEIARFETAIRGQYELLSREPTIRAEAEAYHDYLRPETDPPLTIASALREIEDLGTQSGVALGEVKPLEATAAQELVIDVQCRGSLEQWIRFVYLVQSSTTLFDIQRATLARTKDDPSLVEGALRLSSKSVKTSQAGGTLSG